MRRRFRSTSSRIWHALAKILCVEWGEVFRLPSAAVFFLLECSQKVFYGAEGGHSWWVVVFGNVADSFAFEKLLGCISVVGRCQIRPEVVLMITVLFSDEWNDLHAENHTVDLVVHGVASRDSFEICCDMGECVRMHITSKRIELESPGWSGLVRF